MAQVQPTEAGYQNLERQSSQQLRRQYSSHHRVPEDQHLCNSIPQEVVESMRVGFIRKVYGILAAQMLFTVAVAAFCMSSHSIRMTVVGLFGSRYYTLLSLIPLIAVLCALHCLKNEYPWNFALLGVFTLLMSINVGVICAAFAEQGMGMLVLQAFILTAVIFIALTVYSFRSKVDYSWLGAYLFSVLCTMIAVGILGIIFPAVRDTILYSMCGALLFCGYIVYDTQMITQRFGYDDYIIAAIELYLDVINLFLYILEMLSRFKD